MRRFNVFVGARNVAFFAARSLTPNELTVAFRRVFCTKKVPMAMLDGPLRIYAAIVEPNDGDLGRLTEELFALGIVVVGQGDSIDVNTVFDEVPKLSLLLVDDGVGSNVGGALVAQAKFLEPDVPILWVSASTTSLSGFHRIAPDAVLPRPLDVGAVAGIALGRLRAHWYSPALIDALAQSVVETFSATFDEGVEITDVFLKASARAKGPIHAVAPFASVSSSGRLALSADHAGFEKLYRKLLPISGPPGVDELRDVAAELLNRLYGRYKEWSAGHGVLPHCGASGCMTHAEFLHRFRGGQPAVAIEFTTSGGTFLYELALDHFEAIVPAPREADVPARPSGGVLFL